MIDILSYSGLKKGEKFTKDNIWVKRAGKVGIMPTYWYDILGKKAKRGMEADYQLKWRDIG